MSVVEEIVVVAAAAQYHSQCEIALRPTMHWNGMEFTVLDSPRDHLKFDQLSPPEYVFRGCTVEIIVYCLRSHSSFSTSRCMHLQCLEHGLGPLFHRCYRQMWCCAAPWRRGSNFNSRPRKGNQSINRTANHGKQQLETVVAQAFAPHQVLW